SHDSSLPEKIYNSVVSRDSAVKTEIERNLDIVRVLGAEENDHEYDLVLTEEEKKTGDAVFESLKVKTKRSIVGVHIGAENPAKCLPLETLAGVINDCFEHVGFEIILMHGPGEGRRLGALMKMIRVPVHAAPVVPLRIAAALIGRCSLFICNDTGTLHIASALRVPTVSFHALSDPAIWKPGHPRHIGLYAKNGVIGSITQQDILRAIETRGLNARQFQ
ncbi:MAG: hypothetical protein NTV54_03540, partial [Ignavibacteriales bacterium]|nr:hypothetical protein [Ignavibacteriales bacterium]